MARKELLYPHCRSDRIRVKIHSARANITDINTVSLGSCSCSPSSSPTRYSNNGHTLQDQQRNEAEAVGDEEEGKQNFLDYAVSSKESTVSEEASHEEEGKKILDYTTQSKDSTPYKESSHQKRHHHPNQHLRIDNQKGTQTKTQNKTQRNLDFSSTPRRNEYVEHKSVDNFSDQQLQLQNLEIITKIKTRQGCCLNHDSSNSISPDDASSCISSLSANESHDNFSVLEHLPLQRNHSSPLDTYHHYHSNIHRLGKENICENNQARNHYQSARKSGGVPHDVIFRSQGKHINANGKTGLGRNYARDMVQIRRRESESVNAKGLDRDKMVVKYYRQNNFVNASNGSMHQLSFDVNESIVRSRGRPSCIISHKQGGQVATGQDIQTQNQQVGDTSHSPNRVPTTGDIDKLEYSRSLDFQSEFMPPLKSLSADDVLFRSKTKIALCTTAIMSTPSGTTNIGMSRIRSKRGMRRRTMRDECKYLVGKMIPGPIQTYIIRKNGSHLKRSRGYLT